MSSASLNKTFIHSLPNKSLRNFQNDQFGECREVSPYQSREFTFSRFTVNNSSICVNLTLKHYVHFDYEHSKTHCTRTAPYIRPIRVWYLLCMPCLQMLEGYCTRKCVAVETFDSFNDQTTHYEALLSSESLNKTTQFDYIEDYLKLKQIKRYHSQTIL